VNVKVLFQTKFFWPCQDLKYFRENQVKKKFVLGKMRGQHLRCLHWYLKKKFQVKNGTFSDAPFCLLQEQ